MKRIAENPKIKIVLKSRPGVALAYVKNEVHK